MSSSSGDRSPSRFVPLPSISGIFSRRNSSSSRVRPSSEESKRRMSTQLSGTVEPVLKSSRTQDVPEVLAQRKASMSMGDSALQRRGSRIALQQPQRKGSFSSALPPTAEGRRSPTRMSRIGSGQRGLMVQELGAAAKHAPVGDLGKRLDAIGLEMYTMEGDGNCQFRAMAFNLFGSQSHHATVRQAACAHMQKEAEFFSIFFDGDAEFGNYMRDMKRNRTWGDELTLRAVVEAYCCEAHVVTSEPANWYLVYSPETTEVNAKVAAVPRGCALPQKGKQVFLSYISPVHYNAVVASADSVLL